MQRWRMHLLGDAATSVPSGTADA